MDFPPNFSESPIMELSNVTWPDFLQAGFFLYTGHDVAWSAVVLVDILSAIGAAWIGEQVSVWKLFFSFPVDLDGAILLYYIYIPGMSLRPLDSWLGLGDP